MLRLTALAVAAYTSGKAVQLLGSLLQYTGAFVGIGTALVSPLGMILGIVGGIGIALYSYFSWSKKKEEMRLQLENQKMLEESAAKAKDAEQHLFWRMTSQSIDDSVRRLIFERDVMNTLARGSQENIDLLKELVRHLRTVSSNTEQPLHTIMAK